MDNGVILAELNSLKIDCQQVAKSMDVNPLDGERQFLEDPITPPIGGDETKKPFDLERDEDGVLHMVRNVFMSVGELYELEDKEIPEGTKWIWLKTVVECENSEDGKSHGWTLNHSIEFTKSEGAEKTEIWKPLYRLTDNLEIEIDFRGCLYEDGLTTRMARCVYPIIHNPSDPSRDEAFYPKFHIRSCGDMELSWATLMMGSDGAYYIYQDGKSVKISNKDGEDGEDGEGGAVSGYTGTVIAATNPRYDEGSHRLLYTPVSMKFEKGLMKSIQTGSESVIAQAVEESA